MYIKNNYDNNNYNAVGKRLFTTTILADINKQANVLVD
jgi:hypothetical protein